MADLYGDSGLHQYSPLPSEKFIRLLELHPGHGNDSIDCTLHETELENAPKYETISYAWGDPTRKIDILCNGKIVMVTQNLSNALHRLRFKDRPRILWADAICINQNDNVEKGSQVKQMKAIYKNATGICIWLGYTTPEMDPAFKLIDKIVDFGRHATARRTELPDPTAECWSALSIFFSAAWFSRLWVVQEVHGHYCTVFCGEKVIPWEDVVLVASLALHFSGLSSAYPFIQNTIRVLNIDCAGQSYSGSGIFDTFRIFHCSDQRDKVYALLAFQPLSGLQPPIEPDYSKSVAEVFEEATVRIFKSCQSLNLLSGLEHDDKINEEWPSWVPRWDRDRKTQALHKYASGRARSSVPRMKYRPKILTLEGLRITKISWCGAVIGQALMETVDGISETDTLKKSFQKWLSKYPPRIANLLDPLLIYIAMTLTIGLDSDSNCPPLNLSQFRLDFLAYLVDILPSLDILGAEPTLSRALMEEALAGNSRDFCTAAERGCGKKRLFCTEDGAFGIGPRAAQADDHIVLLYGSNAPCVVRKKGLYYQFVGECYLHQHMHGEAIDMAAEGSLLVEEFELR